MSYDLFFIAPDPRAVPTEDELLAFLRQRQRYTVKGDQAVYENEDTGVYFTFDAQKPTADLEGPPAAAPAEAEAAARAMAPVAFNLNYFRPHVFALEAEPELAALVRYFSFQVDDPQNQGMGCGPYSREGFLRGWNAGNEFAYRACLSHKDLALSELRWLPAARLETVWRWNYHCSALQNELGEDIFVPRMLLLDLDGTVVTAVAWTDAMAIALPAVDYVVGCREELASGWLRKKADIVTFAWAELAPLVAPFPRMQQEFGEWHHLAYEQPPKPLVTAFRRKQAEEPAFQGLTLDHVLDEELVRKYGKSGGALAADTPPKQETP